MYVALEKYAMIQKKWKDDPKINTIWQKITAIVQWDRSHATSSHDVKVVHWILIHNLL